MLIFVPTFGFNNITTNGVALGPAAVPSWILVCIFYFLPLTAIIAELASVNKNKRGGIYSWIAYSLGHRWAFFGTWSYFISNLFYLQFVFARIPVMASWALFGENRFTDANVSLLPYYSILLCLMLTWIASRGVKTFSKLSNLGGKLTFAVTGGFIVFAFIAYFRGTPSATEFSVESMMPDFSTSYFATFSWLLLAVAGAEVAGTYIDKIENPLRNFPRGVIMATMLVGAAYILGSLAVSLVASPEVLSEAGLKDAIFVVHKLLAESLGINGELVVRLLALIFLLTSMAAYVVWIESPLRAMFSEVPEGTFPEVLTRKDAEGGMTHALWIQAGVVIILIAIPLIGLESIDSFFRLITDLTALSLVIPYMILAAAYLVFRMNNDPGPFTMMRSNRLAKSVATGTLIISIAAFFGAGIDYYVDAETGWEAAKAIMMTYGGPIVLIALGYGLTHFNNPSSS
ncbi:MAG: amino acid permease [Candidatus Marinimicrobia bacterium]|nr:amino acid permease [Candidatus Neomarinimicrobiota bacterium]